MVRAAAAKVVRRLLLESDFRRLVFRHPDDAVKELRQGVHRLIVVGRRVDTEHAEPVDALDATRKHVKESEHGLEISVHQQRRQRVNHDPVVADSLILVERLEELGEFDPDAGHVDRRGGVLDSFVLADLANALLAGDTVDDRDRSPLVLGASSKVVQNASCTVFRRDHDRSLALFDAVGEDIERERPFSCQWWARDQNIRSR